MGTHGMVKIYGEDGEPLVHVYQHFDGYPSGLGSSIVEHVVGRPIVNGYADLTDRVANGMGNLAAQLIYVLVCENGLVGDTYIVPLDDDKERYVYDVFFNGYGKEVVLTCCEGGQEIFRGSPSEMRDWIKVSGN